MGPTDPVARTRALAAESVRDGDPTGWFDRLYRAAEAGEAVVPWDRRAPHRLLVEWAQRRGVVADGARALVVGCGLGDDAEFVASIGHETTAFDIAEAAVEGARRRFPESDVRYVVANLLDAPPEWREAFGFVLESLTVQSLPERLHPDATRRLAEFVAPGGTLLVVSTARDEGTPVDGPPWPLTRTEVDAFALRELQPVRIEQIPDEQQPSIRRWRAEFRRLPAPRR
jgi:SAM-dependent methyltransferase